MPRPTNVTLQCLRGNASTEGRAEVVHRFSEKWVQFAGAFDGGTLQLQGSIDGSNWEDLSAPPVTAAGLVAVPETVQLLRVKTTVAAGASFAATATMAGFDQTALV